MLTAVFTFTSTYANSSYRLPITDDSRERLLESRMLVCELQGEMRVGIDGPSESIWELETNGSDVSNRKPYKTLSFQKNTSECSQCYEIEAVYLDPSLYTEFPFNLKTYSKQDSSGKLKMMASFNWKGHEDKFTLECKNNK